MSDNLKISESQEDVFSIVRTIDVNGIHYPVFILADNQGNAANVSDGSISIIDHTHKKIHEGKGFTHSDIHYGLIAGGTSIHLIKVGVNPIHIRSFKIETTGAPVTLEYYEGADISTNGNVLGIGNNNRNSLVETTTGLFEGPTIVDNGDRLGGNIIPSVGSKSGGDTDIITGGEWILKPNTNYLYSVKNNDNSDIDFAATLFYYEPLAVVP